MRPPSSGVLTVGQIPGMLQPRDLPSLGPEAVESWRLIGDANCLAFADRGRYMADSDHAPVPAKGLLEPAHLAERAALQDDLAGLGNKVVLRDLTSGLRAIEIGPDGLQGGAVPRREGIALGE